MKREYEEQLKQSLSEIEKLKSQSKMSQNEYQKKLDLVQSKFERGMDTIEKRNKSKCIISWLSIDANIFFLNWQAWVDGVIDILFLLSFLSCVCVNINIKLIWWSNRSIWLDPNILSWPPVPPSQDISDGNLQPAKTYNAISDHPPTILRHPPEIPSL